MTRKEILEIIRGGGSVLLHGRLITTEDEIPSAGKLAATQDERDAEISRLKAQLAELETAGGADDGQKPLSKMNKAELVAEAEKLKVEVTPDAMTNKQIIEAIEAASAAE